ncbi:DUF4336 domain-containing protein [Gilvimarinus sp. SDUM040013]|uniref:DUF4336 domain-containing protein n=1 Tax=Gilvimarinus gilvus TaxID=3058038 RepID=A0ABU4RZA9_9GAMM|nr:DUF4336 domain-containing protein [Gilvimarinus sp. SDUM040013]MDO3384627.1 DUF4336 domain-containing protein [Gilvimarinus sp. SDUM040013]MDX6850213.1 DUF4336 domain-containing protein [Gilvimarinus sp. SDUM040013]
MDIVKEISEDIWIVDGDAVPWFGMPYTTRTTIVRLENGDLWVHSPGKLSSELCSEIGILGPVKHLVSPNKIHHLFMEEWKAHYPEAILYASPGLKDKRPDIKFAENLEDYPNKYWEGEIDQIIFKGSSVMEEVVFYHRASQTLILTDLVENFHPDYFSGYQKVLAKITGIVSPNGKTPLDWRMSFLLGKSQARSCLETMISWSPRRIIISHGECIFNDAIDFIKKSFSWLGST